MTGHVEAVACGPAMARAYAEVSGRADVRLEEVAGLAATGDRVAREVIANGGRALGEAVAAVVLAVDLELIVVGGGAGCGLGEPYRQAIRAGVDSVLPHGLRTNVRGAVLGPAAAVVGAAALIWGA
jgi:glucokinase